MITGIFRLLIVIVALIGSFAGWWGWAGFWFALLGGTQFRINGDIA